MRWKRLGSNSQDDGVVRRWLGGENGKTERESKERQRSIDGMRVLRVGRVRDDCARVARAKIGRLLISDFGKVESDKTFDIVCLTQGMFHFIVSKRLEILSRVLWTTNLLYTTSVDILLTFHRYLLSTFTCDNRQSSVNFKRRVPRRRTSYTEACLREM